MEWLQPYEESLAAVAAVIRLVLEAVAVSCIAIGLIAALKMAINNLQQVDPSESFAKLRLVFGSWLTLALEFQLAADILSTTIAPSMDALAKLGAIAVIRTFLNYFLRQELEAEKSAQRG